MIRIIFEGLMLGVSAGAYCLSTCLVFFMPYLLAEGRQKVFENAGKIGLFMLGRFIAYIGFALIMGFLGAAYRNIFSAKFSNLSLIAVSLLMLLYALSRSFPGVKFCNFLLPRFSANHLPFFLGFFSGLNPCLPFLVGVSRLWTLNSIFGGVILFAAFFLGTSIYMIPLVFISYFNRRERFQQVGAIVALLSSLWFLFTGISGLVLH